MAMLALFHMTEKQQDFVAKVAGIKIVKHFLICCYAVLTDSNAVKTQCPRKLAQALEYQF